MNIFYFRSSTTDQDWQYQKKAMAHLMAGIEGHDYQIFSDLATGNNQKRKGFQDMSKALRQGDTVLIYELSRLGRNAIQLSTLLDEWSSKGIGLTVLKQQEFSFKAGDKLTTMQSLMLSIMAHVAQMETELRKERQLSGIVAAKEAGKYKGKQANKELHAAVREKLLKGGSINKTAESSQCSRATVIRIRKEMKEKGELA